MSEQWYPMWTLSEEYTELLLIPISDIHYGADTFSHKHLQYTVDFIANKPNARAIGTGDWLEAAIAGSCSDIYSQTVSPQQQMKDLIKIFEPIKDKFLGFVTGNHENRIYKATGIDITSLIADKFDAPYRPEGMMIKVAIGAGAERHPNQQYVFKIYFTHGYGGARTKSAKAVKAERVATWIDADCYVVSHDHVVNVAPDIYLEVDRRTYPVGKRWTEGKMQAKRKMLVKSNAYLKWGGYSEMLGFPPVDLTTPVIQLLTPDSPYWDFYPGRRQQAVKVAV